MPRLLIGSHRNKHVCYSVFPSDIQRIRRESLRFGSVSRAVLAAVEVFNERLSASGRVEEKYVTTDELKAPMSFNFTPRTTKLISLLAEDPAYGSKSNVIAAAAHWLSDPSRR